MAGLGTKLAWRGRVIVGEVHDENAYAVGGVAGHAGLFSTAEDLAVFCRALLAGRILSIGVLEEMTTLGVKPLYPWQGIGWEMDPWATKKKGYLPSRSVFGHTGWTGTSTGEGTRRRFCGRATSRGRTPA